MNKKEQARELSLQIFALQKRATEMTVFTALSLVKEAAAKQASLNILLIQIIEE